MKRYNPSFEDGLTDEQVSERIKEATPEKFLCDDYNPLIDVNGDNLSTLYSDYENKL